MSTRRWGGIGILAVLLVVGTHFLWPQPAPDSAARTFHGLSLRSTTRAGDLSVDLYVPARGTSATKPPLLVFLQGNDPSQPDEKAFLGASVADTMERKGIATLSIAFRIENGKKLRTAAADVAAVIAEVATDHPEFSRVVLLGRASGAWMAALLALDRRVLEGAGFDPKRIDGVIALRGTYDLDAAALAGHPDAAFYAASAQDGDDRADASPIRFVRADAPPFLFLNGGDDDGNWARLARSFARALEKAGTREPNGLGVQSYVIPARDSRSIMNWAGATNALGDLVLSFVSTGPLPQPIDGFFGVRQKWSTKPPLDNDEFWSDEKRVASFPVDAEFRTTLMVVFDRIPFELSPLPGKTYSAIDLLPYLASRPESEVGKGNFLVVTNIRGEAQYFAREDLETTKPVLVVGLDDERNLYRVFTYYRLSRALSWVKGEEPMPTMVRPLGAFLHFRSAPPPSMRNKSFAPFGLTSKSFHWVEQDPLGPVRSLTGDLRETMIGEQGCLKCHMFRGVGARSHHVLATDGKPYGAFALPLEEYPTDVLRRFLFEQEAVAKSFDVFPLRVEKRTAQALFDMVAHDPK